ncbi:MAG: hypothetical protein HGA44_05570 [Cellulomonadaceae bacterium]|nr:hypothetical protein [Cellulomonadaceae bacterium]
MSTLSASRAALGAVLEGTGLHVYEYVPGRPHPPAAIITPGSPFLDSGDAFGTHRLHLTVSLVAAPGPAEHVTSALDDLICAAVLAVEEAWDVEDVSTYYPFQANGAQYLACDVRVADTIRISKED